MRKIFLILSLFIFSCDEEAKHGCLDSTACNYNSTATIDNNSCIYESDCNGVCGGDAVEDECGECGGDGVLNGCGTCDDDCVLGCTAESACNFNPEATHSDGTCIQQEGCNDWCPGDNGSPLEFDECGVCGGPGLLDCAGACNENVELWGECYNIETTTYLDLGDNQLTGEIPSEIGNLTNLIELFLSNNQLTGEIPSEIGNLTNLTYLVLRNNQLTGEIPSEIGDLVNLLSLDLQNNQFISLPQNIGNLTNLFWLDLAINQLSSIPESIGTVGSNQLEIHVDISLRNNQLTSIPQTICDFEYHITINVDYNQLCDEYHYDCNDNGQYDNIWWGTQDQSNCCEGPNGEPNWTQCP